MTFEERTTVRAALNVAKRAWLEQAKGYTAVERDARAQERYINGESNMIRVTDASHNGTYVEGARHGTERGYKQRCRCAECTFAMSEARKSRRRRQKHFSKHGQASTYRNGCRCPECREAHRLDWLERRAVDSQSTGHVR